MAITAQTQIKQIATDLNDITSIRWTIPELCQFYNDGQRDIVVNQPNARNIRTTLALVAGYKQALQAGGEMLVDVLSNSGAPNRAITKTNRKLLDAQLPNWRSQTGVVEILHFMYDPRDPKNFDVYPPAALGASVEYEYVGLPVDIAIPGAGTTYADVTGNFGLSDLFSNALVNYIKYRCYTKNTEFAADPGRAQAFYQAYANDLGVELKGLITMAQSQSSRNI